MDQDLKDKLAKGRARVKAEKEAEIKARHDNAVAEVKKESPDLSGDALEVEVKKFLAKSDAKAKVEEFQTGLVDAVLEMASVEGKAPEQAKLYGYINTAFKKANNGKSAHWGKNREKQYGLFAKEELTKDDLPAMQTCIELLAGQSIQVMRSS